MPKISAERKQFYKSKIRSLLAIDHQMSNREIESQLEQNGINLEEHYIGKLRRSIETEKSLRTDRLTLNHALATVSDVLSETTRLAWDIALSKGAKPQDRIAAMREIRKSHTDMFNLLFDAGIFNRKLGTLEHEIRNAPLSEEKKKTIREVFGKWGLLAAKESELIADQKYESIPAAKA